MRGHIPFAIAALTASVLFGCGGGGEPGAPGGQTQATGGAGRAGGPGEVGIGVQPVPNTPVESLPSHSGHQPLEESPAPPAPEREPETPYSREWFVSPSGSDTADGSQATPFQTIGKAVSVAGPGELIRVQAGTYPEKVVLDAAAGRPGAKITIQGEGKPRVVPGPGPGAVVQFKKPHWVVDGLVIDVQGQKSYAVAFQGDTEGTVLANNEIKGGASGAGVTTYESARGVTIENNHIHSFKQGDVDSHGIVVQPSSRNVTVRNNDIHDNSGDSVQCIGPEGFSDLPPADGLVIENNHFYANRENAIDIKTCANVDIRNNRVHGFRPSSTAKGDAIVVHMSSRNVTVEGNDVFDAAKGISVGGNREGPPPTNIVVQKNRVHDLTTEGGGEGTGIRVETSRDAKILNNTITRVPGYAIVIGHGTGGPSENLVIRNNIVQNAKGVSIGIQRPGLAMDQNLYSADAAFASGGAGGSLEALRAEGLDVASTVGDAELSGDELAPGQAAVDKGADVGLPYCGSRPDLGALETGC